MSLFKLSLAVSAAALLGAAPLSVALAKADPMALATKALTREMSLSDLQVAMKRGTFSSAELTQAALSRIKAKDAQLHAVIALNPDALAQAKAIDLARKAGQSLGPLMGVPILIKDNVE